jgi:hypothetical protein
MPNLRELARKMVERARQDIRDDLRARRLPEAAPIPMTDWLAQLDARVAQQTNPPPPEDDDEGEGEEDSFDWEDFDRRR